MNKPNQTFYSVSIRNGRPGLTMFAVFSGGHDELHEGAGFDVNALYDVTRNIICEQKVTIPYPEMYWTAEVQFDRAEGTINNPERLYSEDRPGADHCGLLFSVSLKNIQEK